MARPKGSRNRALTITRCILVHLAELGEGTLDSFFPAKYPEARMWRNLLGLEPSYCFRRDSFRTLLSRLQAQGLVTRAASNQDRWCLTSHGWAHVRHQPGALPQSDGVRRLVIFDIPERERKKRNALRLELLAAGFTQLQKSVWSGYQPLPKDFTELVDELRLRSHVHIFSVRDAGTLPS